MIYQITNQRELRRLFWLEHPQLERKKMHYFSNEPAYKTDTRCAWIDWIDQLARDGVISQNLAERATL